MAVKNKGGHIMLQISDIVKLLDYLLSKWEMHKKQKNDEKQKELEKRRKKLFEIIDKLYDIAPEKVTFRNDSVSVCYIIRALTKLYLEFTSIYQGKIEETIFVNKVWNQIKEPYLLMHRYCEGRTEKIDISTFRYIYARAFDYLDYAMVFATIHPMLEEEYLHDFEEMFSEEGSCFSEPL